MKTAIPRLEALMRFIVFGRLLFSAIYLFTLKFIPYSFEKLSEESLTRPPEEVFDLLEKLGEGYVSDVVFL